MNASRANERKFITIFFRKIENAIENEELDKAELSVKRALKNALYDQRSKSVLYSYLGRISFLKGDFDSAKKILNIALKLDSENQDALFYLTNIFMSEHNVAKALKYVNQNLSINPGEIAYLVQRTWCLILLGEHEQAKRLYKKLISIKGIGPQGFVDIGMAYLLQEDFEGARKTIFKALASFPENILLESVLYEMNEIEENFYFYRKEFFFKKLNNIFSQQKIYISALRQLVSGMTLRGYFQFEIDKASDFLVALNKCNINFKSDGGLAAAIEFLISDFIGESDSIKNVIINYYNTTNYYLKKYLDIFQTEAYQQLDELNKDLMMHYELNVDYFFENSFSEDDDE